MSSPSHPLARELHFHIVLLGAKVLRYSTTLDSASKWKLKDQILSVGLAWFANPPRWSFGGNRLQVKAETHLLADVANALQYIRDLGLHETLSRTSFLQKQTLLDMLIVSEQTRLMVWLFPLDHGSRHHFAAGHKRQMPGDVCEIHSITVVNADSLKDSILGLLPLAWSESPALAVALTQRFRSQSLVAAVRRMILDDPRSATSSAEALRLMLGETLPEDVTSQLRVSCKGVCSCDHG